MIDKYFTMKQMILLAKGIYRGYDLTNIIAQNIPEFRSLLYTKRVASRNRQTLVEIAVQETISQGNDPDLTCRQASTPSGNYPFLEIVNGHTITTIAQVRSKMCLPSFAKYRQARSASNQLSIFEEENKPPDCIYFLLTHGYRTDYPLFVGLGIPTHDLKSFIDYKSIMVPVPVESKDNEEEDFMLQLTKMAEGSIKYDEEETND